MADNQGEDGTPKGNEWEVVALTESTYAAAPGPIQDIADTAVGGFIGHDESETSAALFLSGHFGVAAGTHENLPLNLEEKLKPGEPGSEPKTHEQETGGKLGQKDEENLHITGLLSDEFHDSPKLNEKSNLVSFYSSGFGDVTSPKLMEKEHNVYDETAASISSVLTEGSGVSDLHESPKQPLNPATLSSQKPVESDMIDELPPDLPSESWWGKHALSFYELVKTADPFWSVVAAATVVGLIIIGHRWRQDKPEILHLSSRFLTNDEGPSWVVSPMAQFKEFNWDGKHGPHIKLASFVQH